MKLAKLLICFLSLGIVYTADAQCPDDNTFLMNATPPASTGISTTTVSCINGGQYVTVNVVAGNTYTFSTCGNTAFDTEITVLNTATNAVVGYNDDDCGVQSTVTWVATFTGSVDVLVDQYSCSNTGLCTDLVITSTPAVQTGAGCNTNTTICTAGQAGPFNFSTPGPPVSSCLNFFGPNYGYIILYITQSGPLQMLINGDATTGFLDVAIFDVTGAADPCTAILNNTNEIACNYAAASSGCNEIGTNFGCASSIPSPMVTAGDVLFIVVENWSGTSTTFTLDLGPAPAAQTGPPDGTITQVGPFCNTDAPIQLNAVDNGGNWSGPGVSASGLFDPGAVGPGTYTIDYAIGSSPCADADQTTIVVTNCNCLITTFSANIGSCEAATNTFTVDGDFMYTGNPGAGNLIVEVTNGSGTYTQTFTPPFTDGQLYNYSISGVPSDGTPLTVTIYFANDMSCTAQIPSTSPASCACNVDIGTFTVTTDGTQSGNDFVLCYGDVLDITANGDYTPAAEANNPPGPVYTPGIAWLVYACPPTVALTPDPVLTIPDDPCLLGIVSGTNLNELNDMFWINAYPPGTFTNNTVYFMPITMYSTTNSPAIYSYTNTTMPCYETGNIYSVQYIPEITVVSVEDCAAGTVTSTVSGGEPSMNGSVFTGTNLVPATASFAPGTATNGGNIVVTGLVDGDVYSYDIIDASGCPITVSGTFVGLEDPSFSYPQAAYCQSAANPSPTITGDAGGTFSSTAGLSINTSTGLINLAASTAGTYTITYQTPDPSCFATSTFVLTINPLPIVDGNDATICAGGSVTLNGTGADTYTWNNGVTNGVAFSPAATTTYTVTGTITATGCSNTGTATVTVAPLDNPSFTTTNYCAGSASPAPVVTGLSGGTFAFNPVPMGPTINPTTGVITGGVGGTTYTIEYTTNGPCPQSSTQTITVNALPPVDAQDVSICLGGTATITATGAATYNWDNGLGAGQSHNVTPAVNTVYTVTGTDANGCVNTDIMTVSVLANAPISAGADVTICAGDAVTLTATGGATYNWTAPINAAGATQNVSPAATTTYTVNGTDAAGCTGTDQVVVTVNPLPTATIAGTATVCQNDASPTITFAGANGTAPYTFIYTINGGANQTVVSTGTTATVAAPTGTVGTFNYNLVSVSESSANACSQTQTGTATVTVSPLPTATIAGTATVCQNSASPTITFTGANGTAPYTFTYTINGGANQTVVSTGATATVTAPTGTVGTFSYNLVSVSESSGSGCSQAQTGSATITVNALPTATIAGTMAVCQNGASPTITFTGANGTAPYTFTYNINGGANQTVVSTGATATVTAPTGTVGTFNYNLVSVSESSVNGCSQAQTGTATITVNPNPTPVINGAAQYCAGTTSTLSTSMAYASYVWSTGSTNPTVNVTDADNPITVTVTNAQGCTGTSAVFTVIENNVATYNTTIEICQGATATIHGNVQSTSGVYSQTFILGTGCDSTSNVTLVVHPLPVINAGADQIVCDGTPITLNATGAPNIVWDNGVTNGVPFYQAVGATNYTATGTDANGCVNTDVVNVTVNPLPTATIAGTVTVCQNDANPTITFTGASGTAPYTFTYSINGGTNQTVISTGTTATVSAPTATTGTFNYNLVSVSESSANGCSQTQTGTATVTVNVLPTATIAGTVTVCQNDASPTITFTGANGTAPYTFTYNIDGGTNQTVVSTGATATVTAPTGVAGTFNFNLVSVSESSATGCSQAQTGTATVTVNLLPTATIAGTISVCQNDVEPTITFTGADGTAPYTFTYNINGGANQTVTSVGTTATINAPTTATGIFDYNLVSVSDASSTGCSQAQLATATVTVTPNPTATISGTIDVCLGDANPTITLTGANGTAPYTFTYNVNNTGNVTVTSVGDVATISVPTLVAGVFNFNLVSVDDASAGCSQVQSGTATVTVNDLPIVFAGNDLTICEGDQAVLTGSGAVGYVWDQGVLNGVLFTPAMTNTYTVTGTDVNGCVNTDDVTITLEAAPVVSFIGDNLAGCAPLTVTFTNTTPGSLDNCVWTLENGTVLNGCGSVTTTFNSPGTYDVTLTTTSTTGCTASATYTDYIYVEADPVASFSPSSTLISNLNPEVYFENTSTGAVDYDWNFGTGTPTVHVVSPIYQFPDEDPGTYNVELIAYSALGCTDTAYATIQLTEEVIFYVPNSFTPDDDDYNPTFQPVFSSGYDPYDFTLLIFNRWGEIIFESHNADIGWDGTYGGVLMQDGTYTWKIEFKTTTSDERKVVVGHVNLLE